MSYQANWRLNHLAGWSIAKDCKTEQHPGMRLRQEKGKLNTSDANKGIYESLQSRLLVDIIMTMHAAKPIVLVIDDTPDKHKLITFLLRDFKADLKHAFGASDGLAMAVSFKPDLI
ncbi:MAG: hypothetical protein NTW52_10490 [Planctomycetota bacterium]|nr:hypothetical protein [Planctomycetota bacterium]